MAKPQKSRKKLVAGDSPPADFDYFQHRAADLYGSLAELSKVVTGHHDMLRRALKRERHWKITELVSMAEALQIPPGALFRKLGYSLNDTLIPVAGRVAPSGFVLPLTSTVPHTAPAPADTDLTHYCALIVDAPYASLGIYHGSFLYFQPATGVRPDAFGVLSVIEMGESAQSVVGVLGRPTGGVSPIQLIGGVGQLESTEVASAAPVRWIKVT